MKTTWLTTIAVSALLISLLATACPCPVKAASTDYIGFDSGVYIYSPLNVTYQYNNLVLNLGLSGAGNLGGLDPQISMNYSIDGIYNGSVPLMSNGEMHVSTRAVATVNLPEVPDGSHTLTIYLYGLNQRTYEPRYLSYVNTIYFSTIGNPALGPTPTPSSIASPPLNPALIGSFGPYGSFMVTSPKNQTYNMNTLILNITGETTWVTTINNKNLLPTMSYSLNEQKQIPININIEEQNPFEFNQTVVLTPLTNGSHSITIYGTFWGYTPQVTVSFTVDIIQPSISFLPSIQNKTYDKSNVSLGYIVNKPVSQIIYSLDNHANVTSSADTLLTLYNLSNGEHNVIIYAQDENGIISAPNIVYFSVKTYAALPIIAVSVAVAAVVVAAALLVYNKKHKRRK
jgi:hypothetical protein